MLHHLEVPPHLHRNAPAVAAQGYEKTGRHLIELATRLAGLKDLQSVDVLDVGCGVRFTQAIINQGISIRSYTGVESDPSIVDFLKREVEAHDRRFSFWYWDVFNRLYRPSGPRLHSYDRLPLGTYDLIWLFSVFTHLDELDASAMLRILRRHVRSSGKLFFSAFVDPDFDGFEDRSPAAPLEKAFFGKRTLLQMVQRAGWDVEGLYPTDPSSYIVDHLVCSPAGSSEAC